MIGNKMDASGETVCEEHAGSCDLYAGAYGNDAVQ